MTSDVVIVGAGPNGLMLASELLLGGVTPVVLEQRVRPDLAPKANGLAGQVVRILDQRGLYQPLLAAASPPNGSRVAGALFRFAGRQGPVPARSFSFGGLELDLRRLTDNPLPVLPVAQRSLERVLAERAEELGAEIRRGHTVTALTQDDEGVTVDVAHDGRTYRIRARYVVGCDGGHSAVRRLAGIAFPGVTATNAVSRNAHVILPRSVLSRGQLRLAGGQQFTPFAFHRTERGAFSFASLQPGLHIVSSVEWNRTVDDDPPMSVDELRRSVSRVVGADVPMRAPAGPGPHLLRRNTGRNTRLAATYRAGRVFLAGDSAHVHSGLGGPGLNLGLNDVVNLGWKLAAALTNRAAPGLLDTYEAERYPFAEQVNRQTLVQTTLLSPGPGVDASRRQLREYLTEPAHRRELVAIMAGTDLAYPMGDDVPPHPLLGRLAPDLRLITARGRTRIATLLRAARPVLVDLTTGPGLPAPPVGVDAIRATGADRPELAGLLLRPDGYVAWAIDRAAAPNGVDPIAMTGLSVALVRWFRQSR